jgi:hypothetical protein
VFSQLSIDRIARAQKLLRWWLSRSRLPSWAIYSPGGCGTQYMRRYLTECYWDYRCNLIPETNADSHAPFCDRLVSRSRSQRTVYLFSDPYDAVISFFRRREKLGDHWVRAHSKHLGGAYQQLSAEYNLGQFLANGRDLLGLVENVQSWLNASLPTPVIYVKYEGLSQENNQKRLLRFLGVEESAWQPLQWRPRNSSWEEYPEHIAGRLEFLYGTLRERYLQMPDIVIREGLSTESTNSTLQ